MILSSQTSCVRSDALVRLASRASRQRLWPIITMDVLACASRSISRIRCRPVTANPYASIMVMVVLPTPPRRLETAIYLVTGTLPTNYQAFPHHRPLGQQLDDGRATTSRLVLKQTICTS